MAKKYIQNFPIKPKVDYTVRFPRASAEALDLLNKILVFNPYFRLSVNQALDHPFFKNIRKQEMEASALNEIEVEFDNKSN